VELEDTNIHNYLDADKTPEGLAEIGRSRADGVIRREN
jgi:hypothetical protein